MESRRAHWENVYATKAANSVSWYQPVPKPSLEMIQASGIAKDAAIIGGGASVLVDQLLDAGFRDVSVLDIAEPALAVSRSRLGPRANVVRWIASDVLSWIPERRYDLWHDRAVFHFLTDEQERAAYRAVLEKALRPGGSLIIATFAPDGPERCSGLPVHRWSPDDLAGELGAQFQLTDASGEEHHTPSGAIQNFSWTRFTRV